MSDGDPFLKISIDSFKDIDDSTTTLLNIFEFSKNTKTGTHTFTLYSSTLTPELKLKITDILIKCFIRDGGYSGHTVTRTFKNLNIRVSELYLT